MSSATEAGTCWNFNVHQNGGQSFIDIAMRVLEPFFGVWHCIYTDRLYLSVDLAQALHDQQTNFCGSIQLNWRRLAIDLSKKRAGRERAAHIKKMNKTRLISVAPTPLSATNWVTTSWVKTTTTKSKPCTPSSLWTLPRS